MTEIARDGARRMLAAALRAEADTFVAQHAEDVLPDGRQRVVRHGHALGHAEDTRKEIAAILYSLKDGIIRV